MTIKLDKKWVQYLSRQPETGLGYQKVDIRLKDNRVRTNVLVLNAEELELPEGLSGTEIKEIHLHRDDQRT